MINNEIPKTVTYLYLICCSTFLLNSATHTNKKTTDFNFRALIALGSVPTMSVQLYGFMSNNTSESETAFIVYLLFKLLFGYDKTENSFKSFMRQVFVEMS